MNRTFIKTFDADGAIAARRIITTGSADGQIAQASANTDPLIGVSETLGADAGARVDAVLAGIAQVEYGGTITRGAWLTADADGKAIAAAPAAGDNNSVVGIALVAGVDGDYGEVLIAPGQMHGEE